jgi:hypothetical protein
MTVWYVISYNTSLSEMNFGSKCKDLVAPYILMYVSYSRRYQSPILLTIACAFSIVHNVGESNMGWYNGAKKLSHIL